MPLFRIAKCCFVIRDYPVSELEDTSIAVDATYYLQLQLDEQPNEPLLSALGGVTGIQSRIELDLSLWEKHKVTPFFIFDGQPLTGQDEVTSKRGREANSKTDLAWELYFNSKPHEAVKAFGQNTSAFRPQTFYRLLQGILKARGLHFLVAPFKAAGQVRGREYVYSWGKLLTLRRLHTSTLPIRTRSPESWALWSSCSIQFMTW